jgi:hypothetical protein
MHDPAPPSSRHVYRQLSPQVTGWCFVALAALLIALALRSWGDHPAPKLVVWLVFGAVLSWTVLLRPCVVLSLDGVTFRNIIRDVHLPWNQVDVIEPRWNLRIYTPEDHGYTAWAISSQVARPNRGGVGVGGGLGFGGFGGLGRAARADAAAASESAGPKPGKRVTAATVGDDIRKALVEIEEAVEHGTLPEPSGEVRSSWYWPAVGALLAVTIAVVLVMLL